MTKKIIILVLCFICSLNVQADGPPIDTNGHIRVKYISIALTSVQKTHLQSNRWLILTKEQRTTLKKFSFPKYIDILDPFYADCTCGQIYAMWFSPDSIAFRLRDTLDSNLKPNGGDIELFQYYNTDSNFVERADNFYIDITGRVLYKGSPISFDKLGAKFSEVQRTEKIKYITVYRPPKFNDNRDSIIQKTKDRIKISLPLGIDVFWM